eukprot:5925502-Prymnesium_polylepis.2
MCAWPQGSALAAATRDAHLDRRHLGCERERACGSRVAWWQGGSPSSRASSRTRTAGTRPQARLRCGRRGSASAAKTRCRARAEHRSRR